MVSVTHAVTEADAETPRIDLLCDGLDADQRALVEKAVALAEPLYKDQRLGTGETVWRHALGSAMIAASLRLDTETRIAALLFAAAEHTDDVLARIEEEFGAPVAKLVGGLKGLNGLRVITRMTATATAPEIRAQTEVLRKMLLAMVADIRVVLLRLASRTQTLRFFTTQPGAARVVDVARESLDIYAPLANRLGVWQLKWELEDLSFRFLEPDTYKRIARMLDERRVERQQFIDDAIARLKSELAAMGVRAEIYGRPKHIYSIYNKMQKKRLDFSQVYDIRALRVLVGEVKDCYAVLGLVHQIWQPIAKEFDDYISKPKGNNYQSLHTAVLAGDGRAQVADSADWVEKFKRASLDDTIYVLTPQGRVVELPRGATPVDFAYRVHTSLGHRCRGAKVDGHLVSLNTPLDNGQTVEITAAKEGGPSRDWLNAAQGYVHTPRARQKIKQYFAALEEEELLTRGRSFVTKEMQREGQSHASMDDLAGRLGFKDTASLFIAAGRGEIGPRAVQVALREAAATPVEQPAEAEIVIGRSHTPESSGDRILIVGVGKLLTSLGRCCKPAPPDAIDGFVTRGRGISIHRVDCRDFQNLARQHPERVVSAEWGDQAIGGKQAVYPTDIRVVAADRQGLLRDISEVLSREKLNVIAVNTLSRKGAAHMKFTVEVASVAQLQRALTLVRDVQGVEQVERG